MQIITGIDPGKSGAIAQLRIDDHGRVIWVNYVRMPESFNDLHLAIAKLCNGSSKVMIEKVGQFNSSRNHTIAFQFGFQCGRLYAALELCEITPVHITPQSWHKLVGIKHYAGEGKQRSIAAARDIIPNVSFIPAGCRVIHDGVVEACLIAYAGALK